MQRALRRVERIKFDMNTLQATIDAALIEGSTAKRKVEKLARDRNKLTRLARPKKNFLFFGLKGT